MMGAARMKAWHSQPALELASQADCKEFISALPCQMAINSLWSGSVHCNFLLHLLTMVCPLLLLNSKWYQFRMGVTFILDDRTETEAAPVPKTFCDKFQRFYGCPKTKFIWDIVSRA